MHLPCTEKRAELFHPDARYLLASSPSSSPSSSPALGFLHLRYLLDNSLPTLYVYELQLLPTSQRHGLGSHLMHCTLVMSVVLQLSRVTLTVFKSNQAGVALYNKLKLTEDDTSPREDQHADYVILSRVNPAFIA
jgi:ribosomal protein S18 acetylase RimI-like enzyme